MTEQVIQVLKGATPTIHAGDVVDLEKWLASRQERPCPTQVWDKVAKLLTPEHDLSIHQAALAAVYRDWPRETKGPHPIWTPSEQHIADHNVTHFLARFKGDQQFERERTGDPVQDWAALHALSVRDPNLFWSALLLSERSDMQVVMQRLPTCMLQPHDNPDACVWMPGGLMNIAWAALYARRGDADTSRPAIVWADEGAPASIQALTQGQLREAAAQVAAALRTLVNPGDAVAVMLPLTPSAAAVYLGIVLAGCCAVSIADSFAAHEVATRLAISNARLIVTQDVILRGGKALPLFERVVEAHAPRAVILPATLSAPNWCSADHVASGGAQGVTGRAGDGAGAGRGKQQLLAHASVAQAAADKMRPGDLAWEDFISRPGHTAGRDALMAACAAGAAPWGPGATSQLPEAASCLALSAAPSDPTNILFSSGTTGEPKAIVWTHTTPLRCAADGWAHQGLTPADTLAWPTSLGWMMGPWLLYAGLLNGATIALYNGAPLGRDFGVFVGAARVSVLGLVPSIVRAWRHSGCMKGLRWPDLRLFSSTGEASAPDDYQWLVALSSYRAPVVEYCGGTELAGAYITSTTLHRHCASCFSTPAIGTQLVLLTQPAGHAPGNGGAPGFGLSDHGLGAAPVVGEVALVAPTLGASQTLLNRDHYKAYYADMPTYPPSGRPLRRHGDELVRLPGPYYQALGRCDDTMNLGGIKVSSVELERAVVERVQGVAEAAAVGVPTPGGGPEQLVLFVVLRPGSTPPGAKELQAACTAALRQQINPLFKPDKVSVVSSLPRNASNKVMRRVLRDALMAQAGKPKL
mmetsp:Transcript_14712/g.36670  ORF Transcript_14712/g.36670 Transcript_14712/m.36670 type:complete len:810 (-) Transcript_14712:172-2601(-)